MILTVPLLLAVRQAKLTLGALEKAIEYLVQKDIPLTREYLEAVDEQALEEELSEERARTDMQAEEKVWRLWLRSSTYKTRRRISP